MPSAPDRPSVEFDLNTGALAGPDVVHSSKTLGQLVGVFEQEAVRAGMPQDQRVYHVVAHLPVPEQTPGGLFFGTSFIEPGVVGDEFFMTRGHFHARAECGEYYWGVSGTGLLVLMGQDREWRVETVKQGSLHYIPGYTAHRLVNTGHQLLAVGACWPSDAGHDYATIDRGGFSVRVVRSATEPEGFELREVG